MQTFNCHEGVVWSVHFNADGTKIVSTGDDGSIQLYEHQSLVSFHTIPLSILTTISFSEEYRGFMIPNRCTFSTDGEYLFSPANKSSSGSNCRNRMERYPFICRDVELEPKYLYLNKSQTVTVLCHFLVL